MPESFFFEIVGPSYTLTGWDNESNFPYVGRPIVNGEAYGLPLEPDPH